MEPQTNTPAPVAENVVTTLGRAPLMIPDVDLTRRLSEIHDYDELKPINAVLERTTGIFLQWEGFEAWHLELPGWTYEPTLDAFKADAFEERNQTAWPLKDTLTLAQAIEVALLLHSVVPDPTMLPPAVRTQPAN